MTDRPAVRMASGSDAEAIAAIYTPVVRATAISFEIIPPDSEQMLARIVETLDRYPWLVVTDGEGLRGFAYATAHRTRAAYAWSADISVYVASGSQRAGVARALYTSLLQMLTAQGYANAFAGIALPNEASVGLHEALGFTLVGVYRDVGYKLGRWWDVGWWQRRLARTDPPTPPLPWTSLPQAQMAEAISAGTACLRLP